MIRTLRFCARNRCAERCLIEAGLCLDASHVVDDEGEAQAAQQRRQLDDVGGVQMQHEVPAHGPDALQHALEEPHVGPAAEMLDEIEAHAAHPAGLEHGVVLVGHGIVDDGDAAVAAVARGDGVERGAVVAAVAARLHDDRALDAEQAMQRGEIPSGRRAACRSGRARRGTGRPARRHGNARRRPVPAGGNEAGACRGLAAGRISRLPPSRPEIRRLEVSQGV